MYPQTKNKVSKWRLSKVIVLITDRQTNDTEDITKPLRGW